MNIPEKPPSWKELIVDPAKLSGTLEKMSEPAIKDFMLEASNKYLHWDKLKHYLPANLEPREAWLLIKMNRQASQISLPLTFIGKSKLSFGLPAQHLEWIQKIDRQAGSLPDDNDQHLTNALMEEAIASSQLEGASTTRTVAKQMLRINRQPADAAEQMIANNYRAILDIRDLKDANLSSELLCRWQRILTENTLKSPDACGRFRLPEEDVRVEDVRTGEVLHDPPNAAEIAGRIEELCDFANVKAAHFIHPVVKAIILHFAIGFIHPFVDGNGRTARAVFYWYLLKEGYTAFEYLPISRILICAPSKYARAYLYTETDEGDVTYFMHYQLECIVRAIEELHAYLRNQRALQKEALELLEKHPHLNYRQCDMIKHFVGHPGDSCTIPDYAAKFRITYPTAKTDLVGLENAGYLTRFKAGRGTRFKLIADLVAKMQTVKKRKGRLR